MPVNMPVAVVSMATFVPVLKVERGGGSGHG